MTLNRKRALFFASLFIAVSALAFLIIKLAQGYKPDFATKTLKPTGLLVATSEPDGAQILVNGRLKSATNTTLNLPPGEYEIEIKKDGFFSWQKTLTLKKELVVQTDTYLFTAYPNLKVLTFTGASEPLLSPDSQKVAFKVTKASADKQGIWVLDISDRPLSLNREPRQILKTPAVAGRDFSQAEYEWSPDSKQLLVTLGKENFLVDVSRLNPSTLLVDVSQNLRMIKNQWQSEEKIRREAKFGELPEKLQAAIQAAVTDIQFSPDETKILYTATASATIPQKLIPPLPAASTQKESRELEPGKLYVYDLKEDRNFAITAPAESQTSWFSTSKHIFVVQNDKISIAEYDNTNWIDVYTGPFENTFAFPFASGTQILVLTSIGQNTPSNLYAISLR